MISKNYGKILFLVYIYGLYPTSLFSQTFERLPVNISAAKDLGAQLAGKASGFLLSIGMEHLSSWNFSDKSPPAYISLIGLKAESYFFFRHPVAFYANLRFYFPINKVKQIFHYHLSYMGLSMTIGLSLSFYEKALNQSYWMLVANLGLIMTIVKGIGAKEEQILVPRYGGSGLSIYPGEFGFLFELRAVGYVHSVVRITFGLGLEYLGQPLLYVYRYPSTPRSLGSLTLLASFTLGFF